MIRAEKIDEAYRKMNSIVVKTPLQYSDQFSNKYGAEIYFKREDLQIIRSYKIRGSYNFISSLSASNKKRGIVCASAGNHAQGVAYCSKKFKIKTFVFMPKTTPTQKVNRVKHFGGKFTEIRLTGNSFDECSKEAHEFAKKKKTVFVHAFNNEQIIAGQGTVGKEVLEQINKNKKIDFILCPVGGGSLVSGVGVYFKEHSKKTKVIGVEPKGAASMSASIKIGDIVDL